MKTKTALDLAREAAERTLLPAAVQDQVSRALDAARNPSAQAALKSAREALASPVLDAVREALTPTLIESAREVLSARPLFEAAREALNPRVLEEAKRLGEMANQLADPLGPARDAIDHVRAAIGGAGHRYAHTFAALHDRLLSTEGLRALDSLRESADAVQHPLRPSDLQRRAALLTYGGEAALEPGQPRATPAPGAPARSTHTAPSTQHETQSVARAVANAADIGKLIKSAREERGLTQQKLAERAGVGRRFLSELENGKATLEFDKVLDVARAAGLDFFARI